MAFLLANMKQHCKLLLVLRKKNVALGAIPRLQLVHHDIMRVTVGLVSKVKIVNN